MRPFEFRPAMLAIQTILAPACGLCGTITPAALNLTLTPGGCVDQREEVALPATIPDVDVVFVMDTTGSMREEITLLTNTVDQIITDFQSRSVTPRFSLVRHEDYVGLFNSCGYTTNYGSPGDSPYALQAPLNLDPAPVKTSLALLNTRNGMDMPESYSRALYESFSDPANPPTYGSQRYVIAFGDAIPHDCDVYQCIGQPGASTGADPGRDAVAGTPDDLAILDVVQALADLGYALLFFYSGTSPEDFQSWECWAAITGGTAIQISGDGSIPGGLSLPFLVADFLSAHTARCRTLELLPTGGFETWLAQATPGTYPDAALPGAYTFDARICAPPAAAEGAYAFKIEARCDFGGTGSGAVLASQDVEVNIVAPSLHRAKLDSIDPMSPHRGVLFTSPGATGVSLDPAHPAVEYGYVTAVRTGDVDPEDVLLSADPLVYYQIDYTPDLKLEKDPSGRTVVLRF